MRILLPRRALAALGLALGLVVSAATPANASWIFSGYAGGGNHYVSGIHRGFGEANLYRESGTGDMAYIHGNGGKSNTGLVDMQDSCIEAWVDQSGIDEHRAPDVFVNCRAGSSWSGPLDIRWPTLYGAYGTPIGFGGGVNQINSNPDVMVCQVRVSGAQAWDRINPGLPGSNCTGSNLSVGPFHDKVGWIGEWGTTIQNMNDSNEPQHIRANGIATLYQGATMIGGDLLVAIDGSYSARMQQDGNFVVVRGSDNAVLWAASYCGLTPVAGSTITVQADGNLVIYGPSGNPGAKWASANMNSCGGGSFGGSSNRLEMQTDGNLVVYSSGGVLWDRL